MEKPVVCLFGVSDQVDLKSQPNPPSEETAVMVTKCYSNDVDLNVILQRDCPDIIVSVGNLADFTRLNGAPFEVRRKWIHFSNDTSWDEVGATAFNCYIMALTRRTRFEVPLVSVVTPTYRTGPRINRAFNSLMNQSYSNWEWILIDDSDNGGLTLRDLEALACRDHRIKVYSAPHSGVIGDVKYRGFALTNGELLVELDHDDALTDHCLEALVLAYSANKDCGFFYTDFSEVDTCLNPLMYGEGWGFGFGSYRLESHKGQLYQVVNAPGINAKTIRHLVAAPNHARAWSRDHYFAIGGHNRQLHVADDFDLMVRSFLATTMVHVDHFGYVQYHDGQNTQRLRNQDIQRHVRYLRWAYDAKIHARFMDLGLNDWVWDDRGFSDLFVENPEDQTNIYAHRTYKPLIPGYHTPLENL
jgi:glycosyltransferase involved in cell wall biosynthesis